MKISIFGTGYVGLVTGTCLAEMGNEVVCVDNDRRKVEQLKAGHIPIYEPGLEDMVPANRAAGRLDFTTDASVAVAHSGVIFIAVGTPSAPDGSADLSQVLQVARHIGQAMAEHKVIVIKSTVPVGTADKVRDCVAAELAVRGVDIPFAIASNPEFLKEGVAVEDFMRPDRIIVGSRDAAALETLRELYAPFQRNHDRIVVMDSRSAELTKYAANAMLATRISYMNELANLAESLGADIELVRRGIGSDPRIGFDFLYAGCGYGGSCFPKDIRALLDTAKAQAGQELQILSAVSRVNANQKRVLADKVKRRFGADLRGRSFALWGLAFKPNTDDMREAPSIAVVEELLAAGATVCAYDPVAAGEAKRVFGDRPGLTYAASPMEAARGRDALLIVTEWKEFRSPDFEGIRQALGSPVIFDGRNMFDPAVPRRHGIEYFPIGR